MDQTYIELSRQLRQTFREQQQIRGAMVNLPFSAWKTAEQQRDFYPFTCVSVKYTNQTNNVFLSPTDITDVMLSLEFFGPAKLIIDYQYKEDESNKLTLIIISWNDQEIYGYLNYDGFSAENEVDSLALHDPRWQIDLDQQTARLNNLAITGIPAASWLALFNWFKNMQADLIELIDL